MTNQRIWLLGSAVVAIAVVVMGWLFGLSPKLTEIATAEAETAAVVQQNVIAESQLQVVKQQYERLPELQAELAELHREVTPINDFTEFVDYLGVLSAEKGASLLKFERDDPAATVLVQDPAAAPAAPAGEAPTDEAAAPAAVPAPTTSNLFAVPITITLGGSDDQILDVVQALQTGEQLFLVTDLSLGGDTERVVEGYIYILADPDIVTAATEAAVGAAQG